MILHAPSGETVQPAIIASQHENAACNRTSEWRAAAGLEAATAMLGEGGDFVVLEPRVVDTAEDFDWSRPETRREFIRLEQKVLAEKATDEEASRYRSMKRDRHSRIFAEKQLRDYSEVRRLQKLEEKLREVQEYLRPIEI
ncbi:MAG: hypothetical protein HS113_14770 [Verrucomicrobiales bacterium]|nr:hypothetical protein [Verrucomicrobiales bacterium]